MNDIKPVLTDERIKSVLDTAKVPEYVCCEYIDIQIARAIEREVLAATMDCQTCDKYAICKNTPDAIGIPYMNCTNQSHYTPTERVDLSLK